MRLAVDIETRLRAPDRTFHLAVRFESDAAVTILFGPSGAGKTLTLYAIAGLLQAQRGEIRLGQRDLFSSMRRIDVPARARNLGLVFQDYALFPHLNVAANVAFACRRRWFARNGARDAYARELLATFELDAQARSYPAQLSGGQRQRVALARALAARPQFLLLDEPFAALDAPLRRRMRAELLALGKRFGIPMLLVTHDPDDVAALDGEVITLDNGRVVASDPATTNAPA